MFFFFLEYVISHSWLRRITHLMRDVHNTLGTGELLIEELYIRFELRIVLLNKKQIKIELTWKMF